MSELTPTQRVFGVSADSGPFELLGLDATITPPDEVRAAATRRMQRLANGEFDPLDVVAAQEAVAAAEAQLLDTDVQREWLRLRNRSAHRPPHSPPPSFDAWAPAVRAALAKAGGWNRRSAAHIGAISLASGAQPPDLIRAAMRHPAPAGAPASLAHAPSPRATTASPDPPPITAPLIAGVAALVLSLVTLLALLVAQSAPPTQPEANTPSPAVSVEPPDLAALEPILPAARTTTEALLLSMEAAADILATSPADAAWRMEEVVVAFAGRWTQADEAQRAGAIELIQRFLSRAAPGGAASSRVVSGVADPLGESPPQPPTPSSARAQVWAGGVVPALLSSGALAPETHEALSQSPTRDAPDTFDAGARAALREVAVSASRRPSTDPAVWDAWVEMLEILTPGRALARQRQTMTLDTIATLLLSPAPPSRSRASLHAVEALLPHAGFDTTRAPVARTRLVEWLDDPRIASIDLAILMRASRQAELASRELAPSATADARAALRDELLGVWGMASPISPAERLAEAWGESLRLVERMPQSGLGDRLERAVAWARLIGAASMAWEGEVIRAQEALSGAHKVSPRAPSPAREHAPASDGRWTVEFHSVRRNTDAALDALDRAARTGELGPIDARTLARLTILGSPPQVRQRAQQITSDRADEANLVEALLEYMPRAPRTPRVSDFLGAIAGESLGSPRDGAWMLRARRAMVARALVLLDPNDPPAGADALESLLRDALLGAPSAGAATPRDAVSALASATDALLKSAEGAGVTTALDAEEVRYRRDGRRRVADGVIQHAAAEALAMSETLAVLVRHERPSRAQEVNAIVRDMTLRQQQAAGVFEQIEAALRASAALWTIRLDFMRSQSAARAPAPTLIAWPVIAAMAALPEHEADTRLGALDGGDAAMYLRLAEEIAYEAEDSDDRTLARRLALLAASIAADDPASAPVAASACLLLADLSTDAQRRNWLKALADAYGARDGLLAWRSEVERDFEARVAAAETLALARAEDNRRAYQRYQRADVRRALEQYGRAIPGGLDTLEHRITHAPSCPECKNERVVRSVSNPNDWVLCHTCRGRPSPQLTRAEVVTLLRIERALLGDSDDWSVALVAIGPAPLRDLTLEEAAQRYNVELDRTVYRDGRWVEPGP